MSSPSTTHERHPISRPEARESGETTGGQHRPALLRPVEAVAFWASIGLPFLYLPLFLSGPTTEAEWVTCIGLLVAHAVALYVGHSYNS